MCKLRKHLRKYRCNLLIIVVQNIQIEFFWHLKFRQNACHCRARASCCFQNLRKLTTTEAQSTQSKHQSENDYGVFNSTWAPNIPKSATVWTVIEESKRRESLAREAHNELPRGLRLAYNLSRDKRPSRLWSRQGCTSSTALSSTMRRSRKRQTFSMLLLVSRTVTYIHTCLKC